MTLILPVLGDLFVLWPMRVHSLLPECLCRGSPPPCLVETCPHVALSCRQACLQAAVLLIITALWRLILTLPPRAFTRSRTVTRESCLTRCPSCPAPHSRALSAPSQVSGPCLLCQQRLMAALLVLLQGLCGARGWHWAPVSEWLAVLPPLRLLCLSQWMLCGVTAAH